ncbi:MAG: hypothetical protein ACPL3C_12095 [Pyrobaculum sp.]
MKTAIRIKETDEKKERWQWLVLNDYGFEYRPYIVVKKDYKGIKTYWVRLWANPSRPIDVVDEYP